MQVFVQTLVGGLGFGAIYALVAIGFSIVYRTMGLVNFAHGDIVMIGAFIGATAFMTSRLPFAVAVLIAIVLTAVIGLVIERALRPLENRDLDLMLIGTIGFGIVLEAIATLIWGATGIAVRTPVGASPFKIAGIYIQPYDLLIIGLAAAAAAAVWFLLTRTKMGAAMQAVAADYEAATAVGINAGRSNAVAFAIGAGLAALAGSLAGPVLYVNESLGATIGISGFAAAILGGFGNIPGAIVGGLVFGLLSGFSAGYFHGDSDLVTFVAFAIIVMIRPTGIFGESHGEPGVKRRLALIAVALAAAYVLPYRLSAYPMQVVDIAMVFALLAIGLHLTLGIAGQINLAQVAFFGVSAYTTAILTTHNGLGFWPAAALGVLAALAAGLIVGVPALRVQSHYLGIVSLGLAIAFLDLVSNSTLAGGSDGVSGIPAPPFFGLDLSSDYLYYYLEALALVLGICFAAFISRTRLGRRLRAMRDDQLAAASIGAEIPYLRIIAFALGGLYGGPGGCPVCGADRIRGPRVREHQRDVPGAGHGHDRRTAQPGGLRPWRAPADRGAGTPAERGGLRAAGLRPGRRGHGDPRPGRPGRAASQGGPGAAAGGRGRRRPGDALPAPASAGAAGRSASAGAAGQPDRGHGAAGRGHHPPVPGCDRPE
jgi:branched-chain amino acid transport system permease protein